ncbi:hypothetical protein CRG98_020231 [Punica granatum]|uniref:Uncharacterized protein n=1 Tax=Punica granatum TaxID=22663 RepID=A0A2I0JU07_PUNGR|nr:hypothetical protein CRG98_020231 [Punica granatum]
MPARHTRSSAWPHADVPIRVPDVLPCAHHCRSCILCTRAPFQAFNRVTRVSNTSPTLSSYPEARKCLDRHSEDHSDLKHAKELLGLPQEEVTKAWLAFLGLRSAFLARSKLDSRVLSCFS